MCKEPECTELSPALQKFYDPVLSNVAIYVGYINNIPFSAIIQDKRSGEHLHFPARDILKMMA